MPEDSEFEHMTGMESIRRRPQMFIGGTDINGLHNMLYEVLDRALEWALEGRCHHITVILHPDDFVTITDDGPGIPITKNTKFGINSIEIAFTMLHTGHYMPEWLPKLQIMGGFHGVGETVINALSERLTVESKYGGLHARLTFERGRPVTDLVIDSLTSDDLTGTSITFKPDPQILPSTRFDIEMLERHLQELAYTVPGTTIVLSDKRQGNSHKEFYSEDEMTDFLSLLPHHAPLLSPIITTQRSIERHLSSSGGLFQLLAGIHHRDRSASYPYQLDADIALRFTQSDTAEMHLWCNTVRLDSDNYLVTNAICHAIRQIALYGWTDHGRQQDSPRQLRIDKSAKLPVGLQVAIHLRFPELQLQSATKHVIENREIEFALALMVHDALLSGEWILTTNSIETIQAIASHILKSDVHQ